MERTPNKMRNQSSKQKPFIQQKEDIWIDIETRD